MGRARKAESGQEPQEQDPTQPETASPDAAAGPDQPQQPQGSQWAARTGGGWTDNDAGVHLLEDHRNRRMTLRFDEKPSEAVRKLIKEEYGYRFDGENQLWWRRINPGTQRQSREEAEDMAFTVANLVRQEKGLPPKQAFSLGPSRN